MKQTDRPDQLYVAAFDSLGFESILCFSDTSKQDTWNALQGKPKSRFPLDRMILRAQLNPHRDPEIWSFWSSIGLETLRRLSKESPQELADQIRKHGTSIFSSAKQEQVIK